MILLLFIQLTDLPIFAYHHFPSIYHFDHTSLQCLFCVTYYYNLLSFIILSNCLSFYLTLFLYTSTINIKKNSSPNNTHSYPLLHPLPPYIDSSVNRSFIPLSFFFRFFSYVIRFPSMMLKILADLL